MSLSRSGWLLTKTQVAIKVIHSQITNGGDITELRLPIWVRTDDHQCMGGTDFSSGSAGRPCGSNMPSITISLLSLASPLLVFFKRRQARGL